MLSLDPEAVGNNPLNNQFNLMGYSALYIIKNFGTLCWTIFVGPVLYLIYKTLFFFFGEKFEEGKIRMEKSMRFNYWIALIDETYLFLAVCCGLNLVYSFRWATAGDAINSLVAICFSAALVVFTVFFATWYPK